MTVGELNEKIQEVINLHGEDVEVRLAHQPRWAFEYSVVGAYTSNECLEVYQTGCEKDAEFATKEAEDIELILYIFEGTQIGYLPGFVAEGWEI